MRNPLPCCVSVQSAALPLLLFVLACTPKNADSGEPVRLRILSYNIHHAEGVDRILDLDRIARVILSVEPDLVAIQEVDNKASRSGSVDQPAELARLTKMHFAFGANIELQGGHYGNALLSKFPIDDFENHLLPNVDDGEQRGVLAASIEIPPLAVPLLVLATHFDHRPIDSERVQSARFINQLVSENKHPAVLAGDFNDVRESETLKLLVSTWTHTSLETLATIPVDQPSRQIDFIFYRPMDRWKVIEVSVLEEAIASDHRAIFAELEWVGTD